MLSGGERLEPLPSTTHPPPTWPPAIKAVHRLASTPCGCHHTLCVCHIESTDTLSFRWQVRRETRLGLGLEATDTVGPSSDGHPRRGFQGHRHSFPTARACAAPPAPAGAPKGTAAHSSNTQQQHTTTTHNSSTQQREQAELAALLCEQAQRTPGLEPPTSATHKCQAQVLRTSNQCASSHAFGVRGSNSVCVRRGGV
jgi:hypothetical protein